MIISTVLTLVVVAIIINSKFYKNIKSNTKHVVLATTVLASLIFPTFTLVLFTAFIYVSVIMATYLAMIFVLAKAAECAVSNKVTTETPANN